MQFCGSVRSQYLNKGKRENLYPYRNLYTTLREAAARLQLNRAYLIRQNYAFTYSAFAIAFASTSSHLILMAITTKFISNTT
ncbi:hypothetical protein NIES4106_27400 [Fischerella sp. NIES-4106]|nr:hypothetical protein NIES4106_27400 [Fischerella sp. NIES-4106]